MKLVITPKIKYIIITLRSSLKGVKRPKNNKFSKLIRTYKMPIVFMLCCTFKSVFIKENWIRKIFTA